MIKLLSISLAAFMVFALTACEFSSQSAATAASSQGKAAATTVPAQSKSSDNKQQSTSVAVDDNLLTVSATLPAVVFRYNDMSDFNTDNYAAENKFIKAVRNNDGSLTITMTKARYKEALAEITASTEKSFSELVGAESTPYIKAVTHTDNYATVTVDVDKDGYDSYWSDVAPFIIGISVISYQSFAGLNQHCELIVRRVDTKEKLESMIFPDAFDQK